MDIVYRPSRVEDRVVDVFIDGADIGVDLEHGAVSRTFYAEGDHVYSRKRVTHDGYQVDVQKKVRDGTLDDLFSQDNLSWEKFRIRTSIKRKREDGVVFLGYRHVDIKVTYSGGKPDRARVTSNATSRSFNLVHGYSGLWSYVNRMLSADPAIARDIVHAHGWIFSKDESQVGDALAEVVGDLDFGSEE
tara:strand:- start:199 stop:765 length:567 start_codon:yes stop_codon:yes gene_type:complete